MPNYMALYYDQETGKPHAVDVSDDAGGSSYLNYNALLSQVATDDPTATVLGADTVGITGIGRTSAGLYPITSDAKFTAGKTVSLFNIGEDASGAIPLVAIGGGVFGYYWIIYQTTSLLTLVVTDAEGTLTELSALLTVPQGIRIDIQVYP